MFVNYQVLWQFLNDVFLIPYIVIVWSKHMCDEGMNKNLFLLEEKR